MMTKPDRESASASMLVILSAPMIDTSKYGNADAVESLFSQGH